VNDATSSGFAGMFKKVCLKGIIIILNINEISQLDCRSFILIFFVAAAMLINVNAGYLPICAKKIKARNDKQ
jgi:hypothetical protein